MMYSLVVCEADCCLDGPSFQVPTQSVCRETADEIAMAAYNRALKLSMPGIVRSLLVWFDQTSIRISHKSLSNMSCYGT
jgi:hypothetical protein